LLGLPFEVRLLPQVLHLLGLRRGKFRFNRQIVLAGASALLPASTSLMVPEPTKAVEINQATPGTAKQ